MATTIIGLMGKKRSGKDTFAERLVSAHGYRRVAFADPIREALLELNPIVSAEEWQDDLELSNHGVDEVRLAELVDRLGWEGAKANPEVRRLLQEFGVGLRRVDNDLWLNAALRKVDAAEGPVVITDVRFPNEFDALAARGATMVRVVRPGTEPSDQHVSETALDDYEPDVEIYNVRGIKELHDEADLTRIFAEEGWETFTAILRHDESPTVHVL